jgi:hypothetical protein
LILAKVVFFLIERHAVTTRQTMSLKRCCLFPILTIPFLGCLPDQPDATGSSVPQYLEVRFPRGGYDVPNGSLYIAFEPDGTLADFDHGVPLPDSVIPQTISWLCPDHSGKSFIVLVPAEHRVNDATVIPALLEKFRDAAEQQMKFIVIIVGGLDAPAQ